MIPSWNALGFFFLTLYVEVFAPSDHSHRMVGIDFGEPTRNCAGRGQICRIDQSEGWSPEAFGEIWFDEEANLHLVFWDFFWEPASEETNPLLDVLSPLSVSLPPTTTAKSPGAVLSLSPGAYVGRRNKGKIYFQLPATWLAAEK